MKIDLHCHSKYSHDNYLEPRDLIDQAVKRNLDGVCFTEHYSYKASRPVEKLLKPDGFFIFRGLEISTNNGHILAYGLQDDAWNQWPRNNYPDIFEVIKSVHDHGGICVPAHPFRGCDSIGDSLLNIDGFDGLETHNGRNPQEENRKAAQIATIRKLSSIGGSDCHTKEQVGRAYTLFDRPVHTMEELVEAIKRGECRGVTQGA